MHAAAMRLTPLETASMVFTSGSALATQVIRIATASAASDAYNNAAFESAFPSTTPRLSRIGTTELQSIFAASSGIF